MFQDKANAPTLTLALLLTLSARAVNSTSSRKTAAASQTPKPNGDDIKRLNAQYARALKLRHKIIALDQHSRMRVPTLTMAAGRTKLSAFITHSFRANRKRHIRDCVEKVGKELEIATLYGDDESTAGSVREVLMEKVYLRINEANIYIAILTPSVANPEAPSAWELVEIGMAIAYRKPMVILAHSAVKKYCMDIFKLYEVPEFDDYVFYDPTKFQAVVRHAFETAESLLLSRAQAEATAMDR